MRKLATWIVVSLGIAALLHRLKRRRAASGPAASLAPPADPADELRQKLAESRSEDVAPEATPEATVAARRAEVHGEARSALDEMHSRDTGQ
jgi:hypothetical protein